MIMPQELLNGMNHDHYVYTYFLNLLSRQCVHNELHSEIDFSINKLLSYNIKCI